jgi:hypothetical protein
VLGELNNIKNDPEMPTTSKVDESFPSFVSFTGFRGSTAGATAVGSVR